MKPIIFCTPMVRAIIDSKKTQTRRVIKLAPGEEAHDGEDGTLHVTIDGRGEVLERKIKPPYKRGDVLWVRETWNKMPVMPLAGTDMEKPLAYRYIYAADGTIEEAAKLAGLGDEYFVNKSIGWKPSIHLPRAGARLFLKVTDVRVERLQDISEADAEAEGVHKAVWATDAVAGDKITQPTFRCGFSHIWDAINAKRGYGWTENPWVWVCEFEMTCIKLEVRV